LVTEASAPTTLMNVPDESKNKTGIIEKKNGGNLKPNLAGISLAGIS
jgi:hypothetical protein